MNRNQQEAPMERSQFRVRMSGPVSIVEVHGALDEAAAANLLEFAAAAVTACPAVQIDLDHVESMTQEAAALLLFRDAPWRTLPRKISLRAGGRPGRQAVLRAYARRRARSRAA
jgi:hypothetical protein